jgi:phosphohistidine phosphatase
MSKNMLLLMRHAKSDWSQASQADKDRPLNARGRAAAPRMAEWLAINHEMPSLILCSTSTRTRETLELMQGFWKTFAETHELALPEEVYVDQLYLAPANLILSIASQYKLHSSIMTLAHNPGTEDLASYLSQRETHIPTGAIAMLESSETGWPIHWLEASSWNWRGLVKPRDLDKHLE